MKRENVSLCKMSLEFEFILTQQTILVFASELYLQYVMSIKTSDASVLTISQEEVLNFHVSGSLRHRKVLEMGKCSLLVALIGI